MSAHFVQMTKDNLGILNLGDFWASSVHVASGETGEKIKAQRKILIFLVPLLDPGLLSTFSSSASIHPFFLSDLLTEFYGSSSFSSLSLSRRDWVCTTLSVSLSLSHLYVLYKQTGMEFWRRGALEGGSSEYWLVEVGHYEREVFARASPGGAVFPIPCDRPIMHFPLLIPLTQVMFTLSSFNISLTCINGDLNNP